MSASAVEQALRAARPRALANLVRYLRDLDDAEDALQEAAIIALGRWPRDGVPDSPAAWLTTTAKRRALDHLRGDGRRNAREELVARLEAIPEDAGLLDDDRLQLIFTACHPALALEHRVALTLQTVCGLTTEEIASAFVMSESALAQRLVRAKRKLRMAGIPYSVPDPDELDERLAGVLAVVYLVFNEGYRATRGSALARDDLAAEALRLGAVVDTLMPNRPEVLGLLALMHLHSARRAARVGRDGTMVLLADQDRAAWDRDHIRVGLAALRRAPWLGPVGPYWLQAAIVAEHVTAARPEATNWPRIRELYEALVELTDSAVVRLNHAVAVSMVEGPSVAWQLVDPLADELAGYAPYHSVRMDLAQRCGDMGAAIAACRRALALTDNEVARMSLAAKLDQFSARLGSARGASVSCEAS